MPGRSLVAVAAAGGAAALVVIVGAVLVVRSCSGDAPAPARAATDPTRAAVVDDGMHAPGSAELRQLGCAHPLVVDMAKLLGDAGHVREGEPHTMVTCDIPAGVDLPTCERVASVYFVAVGGGADAAVGIRVLREGALTPSCSRLYAPSGADLGTFPRGP